MFWPALELRFGGALQQLLKFIAERKSTNYSNTSVDDIASETCFQRCWENGNI